MRLRTWALNVCLLGLAACSTRMTDHPVIAGDLATAEAGDVEESMARQGVVRFRRLEFARWTGGRGAFIDRDDPRTATIPEGAEEARIFAYVIDHPHRGRYLIDAGVSHDLEGRLGPLMRRGIADLNVQVLSSLRDWLVEQEGAPQGVFLTHLHFDHVGGVIDLAPDTPIYVGPGEAAARHWTHWLLGQPVDAILRGRGPLREWRLSPDPMGRFESRLDVFNDGTVWAFWVPGHTPGSMAYLINSTDGPKLIVGDAISTRLNWEHGMPQPLTSAQARADAERSAERLRAFAAEHPEIEVFLGHQSLPGQDEDWASAFTAGQERGEA